MSFTPVMSAHRQPRIPSPEYIAGRVQSISNYKLRLEASQHEPRLRKLLGHIFVYDAIREHKQAQQPVYTSPPAQRRREQQLRRQRQMCESSPTTTTTLSSSECERIAPQQSATPCDNAADIQAYLATLPSSTPSSQPYDFSSFQQAIAYQLATLSQVRIEAASRQLYHMTQDDDDADEDAVEEYASSEDDGDADSDYDSYDGDSSDGGNDWRDDSDTDPDSVNSAPPSPTGEFGDVDMLTSVTKSSCEEADDARVKALTQVSGGCYFLPLRPIPHAV
jgi:hypothetical protein